MLGMGEVERLVVKLVGDSTSYQRMITKAIGQTRSLSLAVKGVGRNISALGGKFRSLGMSASLYLTTPLTMLAGLGIKSFASFDKAMTESTAIMKVTSDQVKALKDQAVSLSSKAPQSAAELARSYYYLASAGKNAEQSMALLPKVMQFATAGAFDMAKATDLLTDAQSALGLTSKDAAEDAKNLTKLSDMLVGANTLANASVEQFSIALTSKAGSAFKSYNIQMEDGIALLAAYADQGIKAELAGNLTSRFLLLLTKAAQDNAAEFDRLGVRVFDASGEFRSFADIIEDVENALRGKGTKEKASILRSLGFEARVQQAILPLIGASGKLRDYNKALGEMGGLTDRVANEQLKSFSNQMKILWNNVTNAAMSIGETLAPYIEQLAGKIKSATEWWRKLNPQAKRTIILVGAVVAAIGPALISLGLITGAIGSVISLVGTLLSPLALAVGVVVSGIVAWAFVIEQLTGSLSSLWKEVSSGGNKAADSLGAFGSVIEATANWVKNLYTTWQSLNIVALKGLKLLLQARELGLVSPWTYLVLPKDMGKTLDEEIARMEKAKRKVENENWGVDARRSVSNWLDAVQEEAEKYTPKIPVVPEFKAPSMGNLPGPGGNKAAGYVATGALMRGSGEALSAFYRHKYGAKEEEPQKQLVQEQKKLVKEAEETNEHLRVIRTSGMEMGPVLTF